MKQQLIIVLMVLAAGLALPACASSSGTPISDDGPLPIEAEELPLITQTAPAAAFEEALLTGVLTYGENKCWRVSQEGTSFLIVWPHGFTATARIGAPQVLDTNGEAVGTVGMEIKIGGGAREADAAAAFENEHPDLPLEQCPGPYWLAGEIPR